MIGVCLLSWEWIFLVVAGRYSRIICIAREEKFASFASANSPCPAKPEELDGLTQPASSHSLASLFRKYLQHVQQTIRS